MHGAFDYRDVSSVHSRRYSRITIPFHQRSLNRPRSSVFAAEPPVRSLLGIIWILHERRLSEMLVPSRYMHTPAVQISRDFSFPYGPPPSLSSPTCPDHSVNHKSQIEAPLSLLPEPRLQCVAPRRDTFSFLPFSFLPVVPHLIYHRFRASPGPPATLRYASSPPNQCSSGQQEVIIENH